MFPPKRIQSLIDREAPPSRAELSPIQAETDRLVGSFMEQMTDGKALASLTAGGLAYRFGRAAVAAPGGGPLVRAVSAGLGLSAEVSAFELTHRGLSGLDRGSLQNPNLWRWDGSGGLAQGILQSFITFGALKGAGHLTRTENIILRHLAQDTAMIAGHQIAGALNIAPRPAGNLAEQFLHAEATNLQVSGGMALAHRLTPGLHALERGLDLASQALRPPQGGSAPLSAASYAWAGGRLAGNPPADIQSNISSPLRVFMKGRPGQGSGEVSSLSNRLLIARIREGDRAAADELLSRAQKEPRLFYRASELKLIIASLRFEKSPAIRGRLLKTADRIVEGAWGILNPSHLEILEDLLREESLYRPALDLLIKIGDRRPDLVGEAEERTDEMPLPIGISRMEPSLIPEAFLAARFKQIEIRAEFIQVEGTLNLFHDSSYSPLAVRFKGDLAEILRDGRTWLRFPPAHRDWLRKLEAAAQKVRSSPSEGQAELNRVVQDYLDDAPRAYSVSPIDSKRFRLMHLSRHEAPEVQKAIREADLSWLRPEEDSEAGRNELLRLAEIGHPRAITGLVEIANGGSEWARRSLRVLEIQDLAAADLSQDLIGQNEWTGWNHRQGLSLKEQEAVAEGNLKLVERALASQDLRLATFALIRLFQIKGTGEEGALRRRLRLYTGPLFDLLKDSPLKSQIDQQLLCDFLEEASRTSLEAVDLLALLGRDGPEPQKILKQLVQDIPFQDSSEMVRIEGHLKFKKIMKIHRQLKDQAIRKRAERALADLMQTD